jgi:hypothetical protein
MMKGFWTCGPFKEAHQRLDQMVFKGEQMKHLLDLLEELEKIENILLESSPEEKMLATLMKLDTEERLNILLGINNGHEEKDDEVSGKAVLESVFNRTKI